MWPERRVANVRLCTSITWRSGRTPGTKCELGRPLPLRICSRGRLDHRRYPALTFENFEPAPIPLSWPQHGSDWGGRALTTFRGVGGRSSALYHPYLHDSPERTIYSGTTTSNSEDSDLSSALMRRHLPLPISIAYTASKDPIYTYKYRRLRKSFPNIPMY